MTSEYDVPEQEPEPDSEPEPEPDTGMYRVNVGITNDVTDTRWEPGDILEVGDIPTHVLNLYIERNYLENVSESNG